jgi:hypothetical protein
MREEESGLDKANASSRALIGQNSLQPSCITDKSPSHLNQIQSLCREEQYISLKIRTKPLLHAVITEKESIMQTTAIAKT